MKGIVFKYQRRNLALGYILGHIHPKGYVSSLGPLSYSNLPDLKPKFDDWVVIKPVYCGICGSDTKQVFLDGNYDNPMTAIISWPQVLGHEVVGYIDQVGSAVTQLKKGDRVVLNPWISCLPRGFNPPCQWCQIGKNTLCRNFTKGRLKPGIHTGNSSDVTGGFAELVPAHESMAVKIPDDISWEQAVLADPFSVALHSILKVRPPPESICAVYGVGTLGLLSVLILKKLFQDLTVIAIARFPHQGNMAKEFGADYIIPAFPSKRVINRIAELTNAEIYYTNQLKQSHPWLLGGVDYLFDTVASVETLHTGIRIMKARDSNQPQGSTIVVTGVAKPGRFEWTPWYFKEIRIIGSNAFAIEEFDGLRTHSYQHYFKFLKKGKLDPSIMISHKIPAKKYAKALIATRYQKKSKAIKVLLTYPQTTTGELI